MEMYLRAQSDLSLCALHVHDRTHLPGGVVSGLLALFLLLESLSRSLLRRAPIAPLGLERRLAFASFFGGLRRGACTAPIRFRLLDGVVIIIAAVKIFRHVARVVGRLWLMMNLLTGIIATREPLLQPECVCMDACWCKIRSSQRL